MFYTVFYRRCNRCVVLIGSKLELLTGYSPHFTDVINLLSELLILTGYFYHFTGCRKLGSRMTAGGIDDTLHDLGLYTKHGILKLQEIWNVSLFKEIRINVVYL